MPDVKPVSADLLIRANLAAAEGPRGFENAMISIIQALSNEASPDDLFWRLSSQSIRKLCILVQRSAPEVLFYGTFV